MPESTSVPKLLFPMSKIPGTVQVAMVGTWVLATEKEPLSHQRKVSDSSSAFGWPFDHIPASWPIWAGPLNQHKKLRTERKRFSSVFCQRSPTPNGRLLFVGCACVFPVVFQGPAGPIVKRPYPQANQNGSLAKIIS